MGLTFTKDFVCASTFCRMSETEEPESNIIVVANPPRNPLTVTALALTAATTTHYDPVTGCWSTCWPSQVLRMRFPDGSPWQDDLHDCTQSSKYHFDFIGSD